MSDSKELKKFPKQVFIQWGSDCDQVSMGDVDFMMTSADEAPDFVGIRAGVYVLKEVVLISEKKTYTRRKCK